MIRVSVLYPNHENARFDFDYYMNRHIPMVGELVGDALQRAEIFKGLSGLANEAAPYVCTVHMFYESIDAFQSSFGAHLDEIIADIPNYTNVQPIVCVEEPV